MLANYTAVAKNVGFHTSWAGACAGALAVTQVHFGTAVCAGVETWWQMSCACLEWQQRYRNNGEENNSR